MCRPSKIDVSTFEDRCVDLRRSMCRPSEIDVLTFEDRWSMCRPSKIDGRCVIRLLYLLKTLILYISCMRITPRVCTSVLSFNLCVFACGHQCTNELLVYIYSIYYYIIVCLVNCQKCVYIFHTELYTILYYSY